MFPRYRLHEGVWFLGAGEEVAGSLAFLRYPLKRKPE